MNFMMVNHKLLCKVFIRNTNLDKKEWVIGEIDKGQLFSEENEWLIVKNGVLVIDTVRQHESIIYKADVDKIIVSKAEKYITFDKSILGLNKLIKLDALT